MGKVKKTTRKFNQRAKKITNKLNSRKGAVLGATDKGKTSTKFDPAQKQKPRLPTQILPKRSRAIKKPKSDSVKQSREEGLVKQLLQPNKDGNASDDSDELDDFVTSDNLNKNKNKNKKKGGAALLTQDSESDYSSDDQDASSDDDIFAEMETEYQPEEIQESDLDSESEIQDQDQKLITPKKAQRSKKQLEPNDIDIDSDSDSDIGADTSITVPIKETKLTKKQAKALKRQEAAKKNSNNEAPKASEKFVDDEASKLKMDIDNLKDQDPEFYEFMKENDPSALEFDLNPDAEDSDIDDSDIEDGDGEDSDKSKSQESIKLEGKKIILTISDLERWEKNLDNTNSLNMLKQVILAFKSASDSDKKADAANTRKYVVRGEDEFHKLMMIAMKQVPNALIHHLPYSKELPSDSAPPSNKKTKLIAAKTIIEQNKKYKSLKPFVKSYLSSLLKVIKQLSDNTMITFALNQSALIIPYFTCLPKLSRVFIREILRLFGSKAVNDDVTISSLLALRRLAASGSPTLVDLSLKGVYLTYVRNSNITGIHSLSHIQLMRNCGVELYEVGGESIYQHTFVYIRQLAIHLRNAMQVKSKESFRVVYNWQFINSLRFWTELLSTYCGDRADDNPELCDLLEPLLYPLIQVIIGVARLVPTSKYFPLKLHCTDMLIRITASTGVFVPILPLLLSIINSPDFTQKRPIQSTAKHLDLGLYVKAPKQYEHTRIYLETVLDKVIEQVARLLAVNCTSIGFPDYVVPLIINLKRWKKRAGSKAFSKHSTLFSKLIDRVNANSAIIIKERSDPKSSLNQKQASFGPSNFAAASNFMATTDPDTMPIKVYSDSIQKVNSIQRKAIFSAINNSDSIEDNE